MKLVDDRHSWMRSQISWGESLVRWVRLKSLERSPLMTLVQSAMGTDGKRASASYEIMKSSASKVRALILSTKSVEFFTT